MADHQHDPNANNLWTYFQNVINWARLDWALYYDMFRDKTLDTVALSRQISTLMRDGDIQRQQGIIPYVLTGDERELDLRAFPDDIKLAVWEEQGHKCAICGKEMDCEFMEGDHITPWKEVDAR